MNGKGNIEYHLQIHWLARGSHDRLWSNGNIQEFFSERSCEARRVVNVFDKVSMEKCAAPRFRLVEQKYTDLWGRMGPRVACRE